MTSRRKIIGIMTLGLAWSVSSSAFANGGGEKTAVDPNVRLTQLGIPVVINGHVVNFIFMNIKILLTPKADSVLLQQKEPFFRDALIRAAHKSDLLVAGRTDQIDVQKFKKVMIPEFSKIAGPGMIRDIEIISQTPKAHQR